MTNTASSQAYDPNRLLDVLAERLGASNDIELSRQLHVSSKVIEKVRSGGVKLSASMLIWMAEAVHIEIDELRKILGDRRAKSRLNHAIAA